MLSHSASSNFFLLAVILCVCLHLFFCSVSRDCSTKCSFHGHCDKDQNCICDKGWAGPTCNMQTCIEECIHGYCDNTTGLCVCDPGVYGKLLCLRPSSNFSCNDIQFDRWFKCRMLLVRFNSFLWLQWSAMLTSQIKFIVHGTIMYM